MEPLSYKIGVRIRELRKAEGLSRESLAELAEMHPNHLGAIERGECNMSLQSLDKIAKALRIALPELVTLPKGKVSTTEKDRLISQIIGFVRDKDVTSLKLIAKVAQDVSAWRDEVGKPE